MTTVPAGTGAECSCPYACGAVRAWDPTRRACAKCGGWLKFCAKGCRTPNRIFARFCRRCREPLAAWDAWPCLGGNPDGTGAWARQSPWRDLAGIRLISPWKEDVTLGSPAHAACVTSASGALLAFTLEGALVMVDLRTGRVVDRNMLGEDPVSLYATGERLLAVSSEKLRLYSLLGRAADDYSAPGPSGFRRLQERQVPATFRRYVGSPIPYGPHLVVAAVGPGAFGLSCLKLDSLDDLWEDDATKSFPGEPAFLLPWGEAGLIVGNRDGQVVGLTGIKGAEAFRVTLPGGLYESFARAAVHAGGLYAFNAAADLIRTELVGRKTSQAVGEVHVEHPSSLGVSAREIVVGNRHGQLARWNAHGLDRRVAQVKLHADLSPGLTLPPVLTEDGCMFAATEGGTLLFFGPRSDAAPLERTFASPSGAGLAAFLLDGNTLIGVSTKGEVLAMKILPEGESAS